MLVFAVAYALARAAGARHRLAALAAVPLGFGWAWLGPLLADAPFRPGTDSAGIATWVVAASLVLVALAPEEMAPSRLQLVRLLVWAVPPVVVWGRYAGYDTRLVSAAWPALILLMAVVLRLALAGAGRHAAPLAAVPALALVWLALSNVYNLDGLGRDGWRQYDGAGLSGLGNAHLMENVALGQFQQELDAVRAQVGPGDRIVGGDGKLAFFFPGRASYDYPTSCGALRGYRVFVLLLSDESVAAAQADGAPATQGEWQACGSPKLTPVASADGVYTVFRIG